MADVWAQDGAGSWTLTTTTPVRTALISGTAQPAIAAFKALLADPADEIAILVHSSPNAMWCYEVYTTGGTGGNIRIRKRVGGTAVAHVSTAAHGLSTGVQFTIEVRVIRGKIEVRLNDSSSTVVTYQIPAGDQALIYDAFGFASAINGAEVLSFQTCTLVAEVSDLSEVLVVICGGECWASTDGLTLFRVDPAAMDVAAPISMTEFEQKMYMVGGGSGRIYDPGTNAVSDWVPTDGSLPGATVGVSGSTTATLIENHIGRLWLGGMPLEPQNLYASALNDPLDWLTGTNLPGEAFALSAANTAKLGQPVVGLLSTSKTRMVIGCSGSFWELVGDPTLEGAVDISPLSRDFGLTGKDAMVMAGEGRVVGLSHYGLVLIPEGSAAGLISTQTVSLNIARSGLTTQVIRDVSRHGVHMFLTAESGASQHYWVDERLNGLDAAVGGYFPETYPAEAGPTCSCVFRGKVLLGGKDGYIRVFDDEAKDDDGQSIVSYCALGVVVAPDLTHDTIMESGELIMGELTDSVSVTVFEAATPEAAYGVRGDRITRWTRRFTSRIILPITRKARGGAIVMDISNEFPDQTWVLEACQVTLTPVQRIHRRYTTTTTSTLETDSTTTTDSTFETGPQTIDSSGTESTGSTDEITVEQTIAGSTGVETIPGETQDTSETLSGSESVTVEDLLCDKWMLSNQTGLWDFGFGIVPVYLLGYEAPFPAAQAEVAASRAVIEAADLPGIEAGANWLIWVVWEGGAVPTPPNLWGINDWLALKDIAPYNEYKPRVFFACKYEMEE